MRLQAGLTPLASQAKGQKPLPYFNGEESRTVNEILFVVEEADDGSFRASAVGTSIHTEADNLEELRQEIRDAVHCHFEEGEAPPLIRLHHVRQEVLAL
jgi:hypothetical protein